ncbi:MAG TPA: dihydrodipicolinate synthase family protein [Bacteroidales bacterium]|nr:dihydrodipicolinate synthase family protein [Bacteroidales bacterium]
MRDIINLKGIFPPLPTAFDAEENLFVSKMQENIQTLSKYDLAGFLVLGSNGELVHLTEEEKVAVYQACRKVIPKDKIMLAGTGGQTTRETIRLSLAAANAGADAVLVLNPFYYKGAMTTKALVAHYHAVADRCPIPLIIYNMPGNSGIDMTADQILAISDHKNIIGLKDSGGNITKIAEIIGRAKPGFQVLAGSAGFLLAAFSVGAVGGIVALANIAPQQCIDIQNLYLNKSFPEAQRLQAKMIPVNTAVTAQWGVPALKTAMDSLGLFGGLPRKPVLPLDESVKTQLLELLKQKNITNI